MHPGPWGYIRMLFLPARPLSAGTLSSPLPYGPLLGERSRASPKCCGQRNALSSRRKLAFSTAAFIQTPSRLVRDMGLPQPWVSGLHNSPGQLGTSPGQSWALSPLCSPTSPRADLRGQEDAVERTDTTPGQVISQTMSWGSQG